MGKEYKVSYKVYHNKRLETVQYNGKAVYPLYIQVLFDRRPVIFKSYYFDLFVKFKYDMSGKAPVPSIRQIVQMEEMAIEYIIEQNKNDFSLEILKEEYGYFCRDILSLMEDDFRYFLYTFFNDEGLPSLAELIEKGSKQVVLVGLLEDFQSILSAQVFGKLMENAVYYAPPYIPLYYLAQRLGGTGKIYTPLPIFRWKQPDIQNEFEQLLISRFPESDINVVRTKVEKYLRI